MLRVRAGVLSLFLACPATRLFKRHSCSKLFVGGLSYDTNEPVLKHAFHEYGAIIEVKVICDRRTGKSKGYGFVQFSSETEAASALKKMDGQLLDGRNIRLASRLYITHHLLLLFCELVNAAGHDHAFGLLDLFTRELEFRRETVRKFNTFLKERWDSVHAAPVVVLPYVNKIEPERSLPKEKVDEPTPKSMQRNGASPKS